MDQDAHGTFAAAKDAGDFGRRHLIDEPQPDRPAAIDRQPRDSCPGARSVGSTDRGRGRIVRPLQLENLIEVDLRMAAPVE